MNHAEAQKKYASGPSCGIPAWFSDEERARYSDLLGYLAARLNYNQNPPHIVEITHPTRGYDDLAAMVRVKELQPLRIVKHEGFVANMISESKRNLMVPKAIKRAHKLFDRPPFMKDDEAVPKPEYESILNRACRKYAHLQYPGDLAADVKVSRGTRTFQLVYNMGRTRAPQDKAAEAESSRFRRHRRGRGPHQVVGLNGSDDPEDPDFFTQDIEFRSPSGTPNLARCRLDSQCEVPLLVSTHWARENDKLPQVSRDFKDPGMMSVSGHEIKVDGVLHNMVFNLRGSTVTYRRDVFVCGDLDGWADMVAGAKFIAEQSAVLFSKAKKMFAGIFSWKKEKKGEKIQRQRLQQEADLEFEESERIRLERKAKEQREKEEARRRKHEAEAQMGQNGQVAGRA